MAVVRFTIALAIAAITFPATAARPDEPPEVVADLRYGVALYDYYQGNYWDALTTLLVADARGGIEGHGQRPKIMEGAFSLAYGLEDRAGAIFDEVLQQERDSGVRDSAWYYLAKIRYLRGDWNGVADALANLSVEPPEKIHSELRALRINFAIRQNDLAAATQLLDSQPPGESWLPYIYYNLGAAHSRAGNYDTAIVFYERVADSISRTSDEHLALYDKAMTAAGYSRMRTQHYPEAQAQFSRVRVASPLSSSAMLGYGWAAAEQDNFIDALTPWQHLAEQSLVDENTQEALLAVPYAYEQLGNKGLALQRFEQAEQRFTQEIDLISDVLASLEGEAILDRLQIEPSGDFNWLSQSPEDQLQPRLVYLSELFARDSFQAQVRELRDLLAIQNRLGDWQEKLTLYSDMLNERERQRSQRVDSLQQQELAQQLTAMRAQREQLAATLARVSEQRDYNALVAGEQARLLERVAAAERNLQLLAAAGRDVSDYQEAHRRYEGLLLWQASEDFTGRVWEARKQLEQLDQQLQALEGARIRVERAVNRAEDLDPYRERISSSQQRLEYQANAIESAIARIRQELRKDIVVVLEAQQDRLRYYLAHARMAVARLYDSARVGEP
mgnify:CR=1 FL=1